MDSRMDTICDLKDCMNIKDGACDSEDRYKNCLYGWYIDSKKKNSYINQLDSKSIRDSLDKASSMYPYEVVGKPETYSLYNAGWQDAIDYLSQLLEI